MCRSQEAGRSLICRIPGERSMREDFNDFQRRILAHARDGLWTTPEEKLEWWQDARKILELIAAMTHQERSNVALLAERERRERIAAACGVSLAEVDQLVAVQKGFTRMLEHMAEQRDRLRRYRESGEDEDE
jgi:predicted RNA-binding Zn ribbon-like protein